MSKFSRKYNTCGDVGIKNNFNLLKIKAVVEILRIYDNGRFRIFLI